MYCRYCGSELPGGARFCGSCGARVGDVAADGVKRISAQETSERGGLLTAFESGRARSRLRMTPLILLVLSLAITSAAAAAVYYAYTQIAQTMQDGVEVPFSDDGEIAFSEPLRSELLSQVDADGDGRIMRSEVRSIVSLDLSNPSIVDVSELSVFESLESLNLVGTGVSKADLSNMGSLVSVNAAGVPLEQLDVSGDVTLEHLECRDEVEVVGLADTQLAEKWLTTSYVCEGMPAAQIVQGRIGPYVKLSINFEYDSRGNMVKCGRGALYAYSAEDAAKSEITYEYDDAGNCVRSSDERNEKTIGARERQLGNDLARVLGSSENGIFTSENGNRYEVQDGKLVHIAYGTSGNGPEFSSWDAYYGYDDAGRWTSYQSTSELFYHTDTWEYDEDGRLVSARRGYGAEDKVGYTATFAYDSRGNMVEYVLTAHGNWRDEWSGDGVSRFTYARKFVPRESYTCWQPMVFLDPMDGPKQFEPWEKAPNGLPTPADAITWL